MWHGKEARLQKVGYQPFSGFSPPLSGLLPGKLCDEGCNPIMKFFFLRAAVCVWCVATTHPVPCKETVTVVHHGWRIISKSGFMEDV